MMHRILQKNALLLGFALLVLVFSGCTEGERGIFATIAIEEEIKKNNLVDNASITGVVKTDIGGNEEYVAVVGTKVFSRSTTGSDWDEISGPGSRLAQYIGGIDTDAPGNDEMGLAEEVYVVYQSSTSQDGVVYRLTDSNGWELAFAPSGSFVDGMIGINDTLFVSTNDGNVYVWDGTANIVGVDPTATISSGFNDGVRDGVEYGVAGDFYILGKSGLLSYIPAGFTSATAFNVTSDSPQSRGIGTATYDGGIIAVTDADGSIFISDQVPADTTADWSLAGGLSRPASDIVWVDVLNNGSGGFLVSTNSDAIRGETGRGYYEADLSGSGGSYSLAFDNELGNNYEASDLAVASINRIKHFGNGVVFALTGGLGLWSTVYPPTGEPEWDWE